MNDKAVFILAHREARRRALATVEAAPDGYKVTVQPPPRSLEQNNLMWALLTELSVKVDWHGQKLAPDDWKTMLSAVLLKQRVVPGIDGGFVVLGASTSKMSKAHMSDLIELIRAFGAERGIEWQEVAAA